MNNFAFSQPDESNHSPQTISELSPAQWTHYLMLMVRYERNELSIKEFKEEWIRYLFRVLPVVTDRGKTNERVDIDSYDLGGFFLEGFNGKVQINTFSVKNNLPQYTWDYTTYAGPQDLCLNLSFGTFLSAYLVFKDYTMNQNPAALRYLFAILYKDGSPLDERVEKLSNIPEHAAFSCYYFFQSVVSHILDGPILMDGEELPLYKVFEEASKKAIESKLGIEEAMYDMAQESGLNLKLSDLREQNLYEVLRYLWFRIKKD